MSSMKTLSGYEFLKSTRVILIFISGCPPPIQKNWGVSFSMQSLNTIGRLSYRMGTEFSS